MSNFIGKKVIVRSNKAGVFYGTLKEVKDGDVTMENVRKIFYWDGAAAIEELAYTGTKKPNNCKFTVVVSEMEISEWVQIIPCTTDAITSIEGVEEWKS